ncbi:MAG: hypothetical protein KKE20_06920, partial [Nanoarchaeota archaeon]|nr:hypothetical protein [Nanoarchaeota archaeon]
MAEEVSMKRIFYTITFLILLCSLCTLFSGCKDNQDNLDNKIPGNDISADSADGAVVPAQDEPVIEEQPIDNQPLDRLNKIPSDAVKMTPETDAAPPKSYSQDYYDPMPLKGMINSAGAEDSAFMMPDGNTIYFFFTPDVRIPAEKQVIDGVTGIYISKKQGNEWQEPKRIILQDKGKLALDGCEFVLGNKMWFCTAREGYTGIHWATAEFRDGE